MICAGLPESLFAGAALLSGARNRAGIRGTQAEPVLYSTNNFAAQIRLVVTPGLNSNTTIKRSLRRGTVRCLP